MRSDKEICCLVVNSSSSSDSIVSLLMVLKRMESKCLSNGINKCNGLSMVAADISDSMSVVTSESDAANVSCSWDSLPVDIKIYILSKVPVVDLGLLKQVCKFWYNLITKDQNFALTKLLEHYRTTAPRFCVLLDRYVYPRDNEGTKSQHFHHYLELEINMDGATVTCVQDLNLSIRNTPGLCREDDAHVFGCCDGLVLFYTLHKGFFVCNPITGSSAILPALHEYQPPYGIWALGYEGTDPNDHCGGRSNKKKYKVVGLRFTEMGPRVSSVISHTLGQTAACKVHEIEAGYIPCGYNMQQVAFTNGTINWLCLRRDVQGVHLLSFDLQKEKIKATRCWNIPPWISTQGILSSTFLFGNSGSLYLIPPATSHSNNNIEIWTMKDWHSMTWVKEHVIIAHSLVQAVPRPRFHISMSSMFFPLGITIDGSKLIIRFGESGYRKLFSYDFASQNVTPLRIESSNANCVSFVQGGRRETPGKRKRPLEKFVGEHVQTKVHVNSLVNWASE